jgi:hypothetical protein
MHIGLFLDDVRNPSQVTWVKYPDEGVIWDVVRTHEEFVSALKNGKKYEVISFDHDLCFEHQRALFEDPFRHLLQDFKTPTGLRSLLHFLELCKYRGEALGKIYVHTLNPVARKLMEATIRGFIEFCHRPPQAIAIAQKSEDAD